MKNNSIPENKTSISKSPPAAKTITYDTLDVILNAIRFAVERHAGGVRKGTSIPYIVHPLETMQILASMQADTNLLIAGVLHDTVEDTDTTIKEITERFGADTGALVSAHTENKEKSWLERKTHTIEQLKNASLRLKMLVLADKLANLRSIASDYQMLGDRLWERFHAPKEKQAWYYNGVLNALEDLQNYHQTADAYWEMANLYKDVFVEYHLDKTNKQLYQTDISGESYFLTKGNPQWTAVQSLPPLLPV